MCASSSTSSLTSRKASWTSLAAAWRQTSQRAASWPISKSIRWACAHRVRMKPPMFSVIKFNKFFLHFDFAICIFGFPHFPIRRTPNKISCCTFLVCYIHCRKNIVSYPNLAYLVSSLFYRVFSSFPAAVFQLPGRSGAAASRPKRNNHKRSRVAAYEYEPRNAMRQQLTVDPCH